MTGDASRKNNFRLRTRRVFITYPQCSDNFRPLLRTFFCQFTPAICSYVEAQEAHQDGGTHHHVFIEFESTFSTRNERIFDIGGRHPNIQPVRSKRAVLEYVKKDGDYTALQRRGTEWQTWDLSSYIKPNWKDAIEAKSKDEFFRLARLANARDWVLQRSNIMQYGDELFRRRINYQSKYDIQSFRDTEILALWKSNNLNHEISRRPMSLVLYGPTRTGKTLWARSQGDHFYMCNMFNVDKLDSSVTYGVFDDIHPTLFGHNWKPWIGCQQEFTVTDKYRKKKSVVWGKPSIFIFNVPEFEQILTLWDWAYVIRNAVIAEITEPLF